MQKLISLHVSLYPQAMNIMAIFDLTDALAFII